VGEKRETRPSAVPGFYEGKAFTISAFLKHANPAQVPSTRAPVAHNGHDRSIGLFDLHKVTRPPGFNDASNIVGRALYVTETPRSAIHNDLETFDHLRTVFWMPIVEKLGIKVD
jgi:hypothetical protein